MNDLNRKLIHMATGLFALLLPFLGPGWSALLALAAFLFNVFWLPTLMPGIYRDEEETSGEAGILLYPLAVLIVILAVGQPQWFHVAAGAWAFLAFGDGASTVVGRLFGRAKLPWNRDKSWAGFFAFIIAGWIMSAILMTWFGYWWIKLHSDVAVMPGMSYLLLGTLIVAIICAFVESSPLPVNDNISVALVSALLLWCFSLGLSGAELIQSIFGKLNILWAILVNAAIAISTAYFGLVALSGAIVGFIVGTIIFACGGWNAYIILLMFFILATAATKYEYASKHDIGVAQEGGGRRGAKHAIANCGTGVFLAFLIGATPFFKEVMSYDPFILAFVAAFATALADTMSSELGQVFGKTPVLVTTLRRVPIGTEGAVSFEGTAWGIVGSAIIALVGCWIFQGLPISAFPIIVLAAFIGTTVESYLGATVEKIKNLDNELMNFANTVVGAIAAVILGRLMLP